MKIVYIHGAGASPTSFNYIASNLPKHDKKMVEYSIRNPLEDNIIKIFSELKNDYRDEEFNIIAHSLGGVISVNLTNFDLNIRKIITMSTPFGGSSHAEILKWIYHNHQLFKDISPKSKIIANTELTKKIPMISFVTTHGVINPVFTEPNDGVVSVSSQKAFKDTKFIELNLNHYEVLLSDDVVKEVKSFMFA